MITKKEFEFLIEKRINPTEQNNNKNLQPLMVNLIKDHVEYIKDLKEEKKLVEGGNIRNDMLVVILMHFHLRPCAYP